MKTLIALVVAMLTASTAFATDNQTWLYERYSYHQCGREYYGYRPVQVAEQKVAVAAAPAGNVDNSVTHSYTYNITYGQQPAVQGSTLYGYSYSSVADVYGNTDIGALYNLAIRLAGDQSAIADKATTNAMSLVAQAGRERAKVAEILAKGQVVAAKAAGDLALVNALSSHQQSSVETVVRTETGSSTGTTPANPINVDTSSVQSIFNAKCVACHKQGKEKGGLKLDDISKLSAEDVRKILTRVVSPNADLRMPKKEDGSPGDSLSVEELATLFKAATN